MQHACAREGHAHIRAACMSARAMHIYMHEVRLGSGFLASCLIAVSGGMLCYSLCYSTCALIAMSGGIHAGMRVRGRTVHT